MANYSGGSGLRGLQVGEVKTEPEDDLSDLFLRGGDLMEAKLPEGKGAFDSTDDAQSLIRKRRASVESDISSVTQANPLNRQLC